VDYNATPRDAQILTLRRTVDLLLAGGQPLILAGDFNVTDREPAYGDLARGLLDAHLEVGLGPGSTWRPNEIKWLPLGVARIDMVFGGNGVRPVSMTVDCTPRGSDHCLIRASMALP
jgi:endonuclease/exonuclease/phosphatase (EEP) superfamily protein YafD